MAFDSVPREALWKVLGKLGVPEVLINIVKSFHENMTAQIRLDGELLEGIGVNNGLRQGCTIAPTLFNLYSCAVTERWFSRIQNVEDVGTRLLYRLDQQLFRRSTSGAEEFDINECQFADDVALLATSRAGAVEAIRGYHSAAVGLGLSVSFIKTKFMVAGHDITEEDTQPIVTSGGNVECVSEFVYLGSQMASDGKLDTEVEKRISTASRAFGALRRADFQDRTLSVLTKRLVYQACVLNVLLYGGECWTPYNRHLVRLNRFHHRCIRTILRISRKKQWEQHITSEVTRQMWGDPETISEKLIKRRLEWLGHLVRMGDSRTPKRTLFGWLPKKQPPGGPRKRWRDVVKADLQTVGLLGTWYTSALHRDQWDNLYNERVSNSQLLARAALPTVQCTVCSRTFCREQDKARHKCIEERLKPVHQQQGALQCAVCERWFRSKGGLAVHNCNPIKHNIFEHAPIPAVENRIQCSICERSFSQSSDLKRHKCLAERSLPIELQHGAIQCSLCHRWFRSKGGLTVHKCRPAE